MRKSKLAHEVEALLDNPETIRPTSGDSDFERAMARLGDYCYENLGYGTSVEYHPAAYGEDEAVEVKVYLGVAFVVIDDAPMPIDSVSKSFYIDPNKPIEPAVKEIAETVAKIQTVFRAAEFHKR